jgi:hypothetical protein
MTRKRAATSERAGSQGTSKIAWVALAIAAGIGLRMWFILHAARLEGDALLYGDIAKSLLAHGVYGFSRAAGAPVPTLIRLPGYPLFLMLTFRVFGSEHYAAVMAVQAAADMATCGLAAGLSARLFGWRGGLGTLWLAVLCPFTANYVAAPLTETLSLFCVALVFYGLERWKARGTGWNRWVWVIGAALGYALLLRPEQGLLAAAVVPAMLWIVWRTQVSKSRPFDKLRAGYGAPNFGWALYAPVYAAALLVVLPLVPWTARNWRTFHVVQPLAPRSAADPGEPVPEGFYRWYRTWAIEFASTEDVYWNYDGASIEIADLPSRAFDNEDQYNRTAEILEQYNRVYNPTPALDAKWEALAEERIRANPVRYYVALPVARLLNMLLRPRFEMMGISLEWWKWRENRRFAILGAAYAGLNLAYFVLGGVGLWLWRQRAWLGQRELAWTMMGFVALRCVLLLTLDNSEPRYTLEFFPVVMVWAGALFAEMPRYRRNLADVGRSKKKADSTTRLPDENTERNAA